MRSREVLRALGAFLVALVGGAGCVTLAPRTMITAVTPNFVYDAPARGAGPKSDVTIAIVKPVVKVRDVGQWGVLQSGAPGTLQTDIQVTRQVEEMKRSFVSSAKKDLDRIMIAKGMRTMGPFDSFEQLTYSEKKQATFALVPEIELRVAWPHTPPGRKFYDVKGQLTVDGEFDLVLSEPLSGQKIWSKRLPLPERSDSFMVSSHSDTNIIAVWTETKDNRPEVAGRLMEAFYKNLMVTIWKQVDVEEFVALKIQSDELKQRVAPTMR